MNAFEKNQEAAASVPSYIAKVPQESIDVEWALYREARTQISPVPTRYRELIGLAVAETEGCRACVLYHSELARLFGATELEIEDAVVLASRLSGRPPCTVGHEDDSDAFRREIANIVAHVSRQQIALRRRAEQHDAEAAAAAAMNERLGWTAYEALNAGALETLGDLVVPDAPMANASTGELHYGSDGYKLLVGRWMEAFPDLHATVERITAGPSALVVESTWTGTHRATLTLSPRTLFASGRTMRVPFCEVMNAREGRITGRILYFDLYALIAQLTPP